MHLHFMGDNQCKVIDDFINYKMSRDDFIAFLTKEMAWYKELKNYRIKFKNMKLSDKNIEDLCLSVDSMANRHMSRILKNAEQAIRQLKEERDRYREALEKIEEGDESEIWETFPDVTYDEAVRLYAKQKLVEDDEKQGG